LRPAPLPKKAPANLLFALARELTPLKVLEPVNVWLPLSNGTLAESRASGRAPDDTLAAFRVVRLVPLPLKVPVNLLFTLVKELAPLKVLEPVKVWLPLSNGTLAERRASKRVPVTSVPKAPGAG